MGERMVMQLKNNTLTQGAGDYSPLNFQSGSFDDSALPIVIVGTGPVGMRFIQALRKRNASVPVILYGKEPWEPYNRVKLSSLLSGDIKIHDINTPLIDLQQKNLITRFNCEVKMIDSVGKFIVDDHGGYQPYSKLVLATGSRPHIPNISGIDSKGVFTFRDLNDAQQLVARQVRARKVVVIGGGVLGLEAAKAMQRNNTEVTVIEHTPRLLSTQLDNEASELLREYILSIGIKVRLGESVKEVVSDKYGLHSVVMSDNSIIECDTIIVSAGIKPNIELARNAHIAVNRGIRVNDSMRSSDPDIYAIGECCEHRQKIYGLVAPGFEQAEVAAHSILHGKSRYEGSISATNIKVIDKTVFSMGEVAFEGYHPDLTEYKYEDHNKGIYRKLVVSKRKIVGAIAVGNWQEQGRVQSLIDNKKYIFPWQLLRFKKTGNLLPDKNEADVSRWPSAAVVCNCTGQTRGEISRAILSGCNSTDKITHKTGAGSVCGSCKPLLNLMIGANEPVSPVKFYKTIGVISVLVLMLYAFFILYGSIGYNYSAAETFKWDTLWRSSLAKQVSGFSIVGLSVIAVMLSLRKRIKKITFWNFDVWRGIHIFVSVFVIGSLLAHTGFRFGNNIDYYLMLAFSAMLLAGSLSAIMISISPRFDAVTIGKIRKNLVWGHILFFWPIPVLLTFHVLKSYYF